MSPFVFRSLKDNQYTDLNYTLSTSLPLMGKSSEISVLMSVTENAETLLIYTYVIPLVLMVFLSFGIEKVWTFY